MSTFNPALLRLICLELGIVPNVSLDKDGDELKHMLEQLTPEEALRCKRKFRKIHRKLRKKSIKNATSKEINIAEARFGSEGKKPTQSQARRRRDIVRSHIRQQSLTKWNNE